MNVQETPGPNVPAPNLPAPKITATDPNSDAAFAERMRYRLTTLLQNPYTFLPSYQDRYQTLLKYCATLTPQQAYAMTMLLGGDSSRYYPDMPNTGELVFPDVNAWQTTAQEGWYYFAGHCVGKDGKTYGVLFMPFGNSLLPPAIAALFGLSDVQNQILDMQMAITVEGGRFYQADPIVTAGTSGNVKVSGEFYLEANSFAVLPTDPSKPVPVKIKAKGTDRSGAVPTDLEIDFTFVRGNAYLPQGLDGGSPLIAGLGTRYYSIPGLVMDATASTLKIGGETVALESGKFWFDHQWGLGMTPGGSPRFEVMRAAANLKPQLPTSWDFFPINLDDGSAMNLSSLHGPDILKYIHQTGPTPPPPMTCPVEGKYQDRFGTVFNLSGQITISDWRKTDGSPNPAKYINTPTWVPHGGEFTLFEGVVPQRYRHFRLQHISDSPQCLWYSQGSQYVEAAVNILGDNGEKVGVGYQEAVGYVNPLNSVLKLAGLPTTPEILALFQAQPVSPTVYWESLLFYLAHITDFNALFAEGSFSPPPRTAGEEWPSVGQLAPGDVNKLLSVLVMPLSRP
jgi:hypothetical protein